MKEETRKRLDAWAAKLDVPVVKLEQQLAAAMTEEKRFHAELSEEDLEDRARKMIALQLSDELRSQAIPFVGYKLGEDEARDITMRIMEAAKMSFKEDPVKAVNSFVTDENGTPLDTREYLDPEQTRKNPRYRKPLRPFFQKPVVLIARKSNDTKLKLTQLLLRQDQSQLEVPDGPIGFRGNLRQDRPFMYLLTSSVATKFTPRPDQAHQFSDILAMLKAAPNELKSTVLELEEWHAAHKTDPNALAIVEADVLNIGEVTDRGSLLLTLGDIEEDPEFSVTCFLASPLVKKITFGRGTRCYFVGRTTLGIDLTTGERDRVLFNGMAIWPISGRVVSKEEEAAFSGEEVEEPAEV